MATVCTPKIKRAQSAKSMGFCLRYVMDRKKTEMSNGKALVSGVRCQPELAYQQFMLTKALAGKNEGRMYYHYVQSFKIGFKLGVRMLLECYDDLAKNLK